jgi:excisionase family DNA binding protein
MEQKCCVCARPIPDGWGAFARLTPAGLTHFQCVPISETAPTPGAAPPPPKVANPVAKLTSDGPELLTIREACALLRVSKNTIRSYIRRGQLPAYRLLFSPLIRLQAKDVRALLEPLVLLPSDTV